jgi:hypothetical protein
VASRTPVLEVSRETVARHTPRGRTILRCVTGGARTARPRVCHHQVAYELPSSRRAFLVDYEVAHLCALPRVRALGNREPRCRQSRGPIPTRHHLVWLRKQLTPQSREHTEQRSSFVGARLVRFSSSPPYQRSRYAGHPTIPSMAGMSDLARLLRISPSSSLCALA